MKLVPGDSIAPYVAIFVDEIQQPRVVEVDDEAGYVERMAIDDAGKFVTEGAELKTERVTGDVQIKLNPNCPADLRKLYPELELMPDHG